MIHFRTILPLFGILFGLKAFGQTDPTQCVSKIDSLTGQRIYTFVDKMPEPKGGQQYLFRQIGKNLKFNELKIDDPATGSMTVVSFVIDEDGKVTDKEVLKEDFPGHSIPDQMFSVIESIEWFPGTCNKVPVKVKHILPLRTCLTR